MANACFRAQVTSISPALLATLDGHVAAKGKFFSESDALSYRADAAVARFIAEMVLVEQQIKAVASGAVGSSDGGPAEAVSRDMAAAACNSGYIGFSHMAPHCDSHAKSSRVEIYF